MFVHTCTEEARAVNSGNIQGTIQIQIWRVDNEVLSYPYWFPRVVEC